ncbi:MAG TPA: response regulator [Elusimicrobiota bacterium]|nr:response regulator [Elusimicrobiota bacterium]
MAKILIADDEADIRDVLRIGLERAGHSVSEASTGSQCLERLKEERPDLLILDVEMPGWDGYTVQLHLSQNVMTAKLPVIVMTGLQPAKKLFENFKQVKGFLNKPFEEGQLVQLVDRCLQKQNP